MRLSSVLLLSLPLAAAEYRAGIARIDITPPVGHETGGYAARKHGATGIHDPLYATVLGTKSPLPNPFLLGYTNGYFAYFPTIAAAVRGGYGANTTVNPSAVGTGERMLNTGLISIYELLGMLKDKPGAPR